MKTSENRIMRKELTKNTKDKYYAFFLDDYAQCGEGLPGGWREGQITWRIPVAWRCRKDETEEYDMKELGCPYYQIFTMSSSGVLRVSKLNHWVERSPDGTMRRSANTLEAFR